MKSIVSYPVRGIGGRSTYRGNCSPELIHDLVNQFQIRQISDFMCGSGTTEDVAKDRQILSHCFDLNRGFDLINNDIPVRSEFIFWHPPYWDIIKYSDVMYKASAIQNQFGFDPKLVDLSRIPTWEGFVKTMNECMMKQFHSLEKGGRMATLVGDIKKKGRLYSMLFELVKPGTIEQVIIKAQHNCVSNQTQYNGKFIPIEHEYLLILKKDNPLFYSIQYSTNKAVDIRDMSKATWRDVICAIFESSNATMTLDQIYDQIQGHRKTESNPHWKEKIRQTLGMHSIFKRKDIGCWYLDKNLQEAA